VALAADLSEVEGGPEPIPPPASGGPWRRARTPESLEEEHRIVLAAKGGDRAAFAELYNQYVDAIHAYAYHQTGSRERAEDVTATTFARAFEEIARFEWRGVPYSAWLYRVASNLLAREHRRPRWSELPDTAMDPGEGPEAAAVRGERALRVRAALQHLSADQRRAVALRYGSGLRNAEVAKVMGKSEGAVKLLIFRATATLRRRLGPDFDEGQLVQPGPTSAGTTP